MVVNDYNCPVEFKNEVEPFLMGNEAGNNLEHRKKGYASNCVAALSQKLLDSGYKYCCLYTDLANPTSNKIYMDIGYRPIADSVVYKFI